MPPPGVSTQASACTNTCNAHCLAANNKTRPLEGAPGPRRDRDAGELRLGAGRKYWRDDPHRGLYDRCAPVLGFTTIVSLKPTVHAPRSGECSISFHRSAGSGARELEAGLACPWRCDPLSEDVCAGPCRNWVGWGKRRPHEVAPGRGRAWPTEMAGKYDSTTGTPSSIRLSHQVIRFG